MFLQRVLRNRAKEKSVMLTIATCTYRKEDCLAVIDNRQNLLDDQGNIKLVRLSDDVRFVEGAFMGKHRKCKLVMT